VHKTEDKLEQDMTKKMENYNPKVDLRNLPSYSEDIKRVLKKDFPVFQNNFDFNINRIEEPYLKLYQTTNFPPTKEGALKPDLDTSARDSLQKSGPNKVNSVQQQEIERQGKQENITPNNDIPVREKNNQNINKNNQNMNNQKQQLADFEALKFQVYNVPNKSSTLDDVYRKLL
jgi:hypothetical protein